jgi:hypothetical protein
VNASAKPQTWKPGESGNPAGRRPRALTVAGLIAPSLRKIVKVLEAAALGGDVQAARLLIEKSVPSLRAESKAVKIPALTAAKTPTEKAEAIVDAAGRGEISASVATELLTAMASAMKVVETDELQRRIAALEGLERPQ